MRQDDRRRVVLRRNYSISALNGYRREWSDFSVEQCNACGREWRTKGDYVSLLPNVEKVVLAVAASVTNAKALDLVKQMIS